MTDSASLLEPGGFFGTYRVVRPLGKGGMGRVYLVDGPESGTRYALKLLDPEVARRNPEFVRRFVREAEFTMNARDANLVEVYDAGQDDETGLCYLAMEYMPGGTLREIIDHDGSLSTKGAWTIARDVARGLRFIEQNGLVHRDIKPDNILFTETGCAKLTDLGITRFGDAELADQTRTMAGLVVGTPGYIAPEQLLDPHAVDIRADIYSLGVILYEMLAGKRPNASDNTISTLAKALQGTVFPDIRLKRPDVPEKLAELIAAMTSPDPAARPASAAYLVELLEGPSLLEVPVARAPTLEPAASAPASAPAPHDAQLAFALAAVGIALVVLIAVMIFLGRGR